jgi:predicted nucleic acid-binding protein
MAAKRIVLDASVVVKWFHDEPGTATALRLQEAINAGELSAAIPDLLLYEVANALVRGIQRPSPEISKALRVLSEMSWELATPSPTLLEDAIALTANRPTLTVYDAVYVALALRREAELVTADEQLHQLIGPPVTRLL